MSESSTDRKTIGDLPGEILRDRIFSRLSVKDQLSCHRVCQRWQSFLPWMGPDKSILLSEIWPNLSRVRQESVTSALNFLLPRTSGLLRSLSIGSLSSRHTDAEVFNAQMDLIAQFCPQLTSLHLGWVTIAEGSQLSPQICKLASLVQIRSFSIAGSLPSDHVDQFNSDLSGLFLNWPMLGQLSLGLWRSGILPNICGANLTHLQVQVKMNDHQLDQICRHCPALTELHLNYVAGVVDYTPLGWLEHLKILDLTKCADLVDLCISCPDLKELRLDNYQTGSRFPPVERNFWPLAQLASLTRLELDDCGELPPLPFDFISSNWTSLTHLVVLRCSGQLSWIRNIPQLMSFRTDQSPDDCASWGHCLRLKSAEFRGVQMIQQK